jgi:hypothetical protein
LLVVDDDKKWFYEFSQSSKNDNLAKQTDEAQILNLALSDVVDSTNGRLKRKLHEVPPPCPDPTTNHIDSSTYKKRLYLKDSFQKILDTCSLYLVVHKENEYTPWVGQIQKQIEGNKVDTVFNGVLKTFCSQNLSRDTIDLNLLKPKYHYKIVAEDADSFDIRRIGYLSFSKIAFNRLRDTACIFTRFSCGEFCGKGGILFMIKRNGGWSIAKKQQLWDDVFK